MDARPLWLLAELTYRCPLQCPYCSNPLDFAGSRFKQELTTEEWSRVFREAKALGVLQLGLSGGEPLLRPDLESLVATAHEVGLYTSLITSAHRHTQDRLAALKRAGLDHVQISVQAADAEPSDRIAGTQAFGDKLAAYHFTKELGFPLTVNVVLHRENLHQVEALIRLAESLGAERIELANTQFYGWAFHNRDALMPTKAQLDAAWQVVVRERARLRTTLETAWALPDYHEQFPKPSMGGWARASLTVPPGGEARPCHAAGRITTLTCAHRRDPRARRARPRGARGRILRPARSQRRRQDHHRPSVGHPAAPHARHGPGRRIRRRARGLGDAAPHRPRVSGDHAGPRSHGGAEPAFRGAAVESAGPGRRPAHRPSARAIRAARATARRGAHLVRRHAAGARHRARAAARAAGAVPGRADRRPRPARPAGVMGTDPTAARGFRADRLPHHPLRRGGGAVRPRRGAR